jgi:hypothetical protein
LQLKREREELYKPKILIDVNLEQSQQRERELEREHARELERQRARTRERIQKERYVEVSMIVVIDSFHCIYGFFHRHKHPVN